MMSTQKGFELSLIYSLILTIDLKSNLSIFVMYLFVVVFVVFVLKFKV